MMKQSPSTLRVAVLKGGDSPEREVSLRSGKGIARALRAVGHSVLEIDLSYRWELAMEPKELSSLGVSNPPEIRCAPEGLPAVLKSFGTEVAFIALHGGYGEDGTLQAFLELLRVPHTSPPAVSCALAMDKWLTKRLLLSEGLPTPKFLIIRQSEVQQDGWLDAHRQVSNELGYPCVVKPRSQGSTIGVSVVSNPRGLQGALELAFEYGGFALVEKKIEGTEVSVPVMGEGDGAAALPVIEIIPKSEAGFYDYEAKYAPGMSEHLIPPNLPDEVIRRAEELGVLTHKLLGCRGVTRTDMMVDTDRERNVWILELNAVPGMTETSLVPDAARAAGISFEELVDHLVSQRSVGRFSSRLMNFNFLIRTS